MTTMFQLATQTTYTDNSTKILLHWNNEAPWDNKYNHTTLTDKTELQSATQLCTTCSISDTNHHRDMILYLYLKIKCRRKRNQKPRMYMTIGDTNIKLRSHREFHNPNDRRSKIYGTMRVLTKDCLSNLTALLYLVEELSINLSIKIVSRIKKDISSLQ